MLAVSVLGSNADVEDNEDNDDCTLLVVSFLVLFVPTPSGHVHVNVAINFRWLNLHHQAQTVTITDNQ